MKKLTRILCLAVIWSIGAANVFAQFNARIKVSPFRLSDVRLLDSPFKRAMQLDAAVLLKIKPDRLLYNFRKNAGLDPKDRIYGGWESREIAGHTLGHYLSAISMQYASTGDKRFLERVDYVIDELAECQSRDADGYVSGIPDGKRIFSKLAQGNIVVKGRHNFDEGWVPWYTMHKLFAGLLDVDEFTGNKKALKILVRLADWADNSTRNLTDEQMQKILSVEHGGMLEALAELSVRTGNPKYLKLAGRFYHKAVLDPLADNRILILEGLHANTQVPKILGAARLYEITGDAKDARIAENFWNEVVHHYTYANGGNSDREVFGKRDQLAARMSGSMTETCNTYNMLKLTRHLFEWNPQAAYFDYYERALYNQILASQDPKTGLGGYKLGLYGGYFQPFSTLEDSFWCCTGSGFENHVKYNDSIYFHSADELYVNLFIPSTLDWKEKDVTLRQETNFPDAETVSLIFDKAKGAKFKLRIRRPAWVGKGLRLTVNSQAFAFEERPDGYLTIDRQWKKGDRVEIALPFALKIERTPDDPNRLAILDGPIVLAGLLGTDNFPPEGPYGQEGSDGWKLPLPAVPQLTGVERPLEDWIKPVEGSSLTFLTFGSNGEPVKLVPLFRSQHNRMTVYWDTKK